MCDTDLTEAEEWVESAAASRGWLIEVFHQIDRGLDYRWTVAPETFDQHVAHLRRTNVWIATQRAVAAYVRTRDAARLFGDSIDGEFQVMVSAPGPVWVVVHVPGFIGAVVVTSDRRGAEHCGVENGRVCMELTPGTHRIRVDNSDSNHAAGD